MAPGSRCPNRPPRPPSRYPRGPRRPCRTRGRRRTCLHPGCRRSHRRRRPERAALHDGYVVSPLATLEGAALHPLDPVPSGAAADEVPSLDREVLRRQRVVAVLITTVREGVRARLGLRTAAPVETPGRGSLRRAGIEVVGDAVPIAVRLRGGGSRAEPEPVPARCSGTRSRGRPPDRCLEAGVEAAAAVQVVIAGVPQELVLARATEELVPAATATDTVGATEAPHGVIATEARR